MPARLVAPLAISLTVSLAAAAPVAATTLPVAARRAVLPLPAEKAQPSALVLFLPPASGKATAPADGRVERSLQSVPSLSIAILSSRQGSYTPVRMARDIALVARLARTPPEHAGRLRVTDLPAGPIGLARLHALVGKRPPGELIVVVQAARDGRAHELLWSAVAGLDPGRQTLTSQTTEQRGLIAAIDIAPTLLDHLRLPIPAAMRGRPIRTDGPLDGAWLRSLKARLEVVYPRRLPALACLLGACGLLALGAWLAPTSLAAGRSALARAMPAALRPGGAPSRGAPSEEAPPEEAPPGQAPPREAQSRGALPEEAPPGEANTTGDRRIREMRLRRAIRVGALALLYAPVAMLIPAALEPGAAGEYALIAGSSLALGALTDALAPWPRALLAPGLAALVAFSADALAGWQLLIRSLLGPNPAYGSRFYGIGNELKSALAVLAFAAVAAALYRSSRSQGRPIGDPVDRRSAAAMAGAGALLAGVEGWARIGAGVGGVVLVCAGTAVATALLLPGRVVSARALAAVAAAPALGLALLAALDLTTAHGTGHFAGSVLDARSAGEVRELVERRYEAAWKELGNGLMPLATALALLLATAGVRCRERLLAPVAGDPAWLAALAGGLTAGVVGALSEDSGPVLLVVAVFTLLCLLAYLWAGPRPQTARQRATAQALTMTGQAADLKGFSTRTESIG